MDSLMAAIGAAVTSYREGSQMSGLVIMPAIVPLIFFTFVAGNPHGGLARALSFIPITSPLTMTIRLGAADIALTEVLASLLVTVRGGLAILWAAARVFRAGLLMYWQRVTLPYVVNDLRGAG